MNEEVDLSHVLSRTQAKPFVVSLEFHGECWPPYQLSLKANEIICVCSSVI